MVKQQTLDLIVRRPRVALIEEADTEVVRVRVPRKAAATIAAADPKDVELALQVKAAEMLAALVTKWFCWETPPCQGLYEVTEHRTGATIERFWFHGGSVWKKSPDRYANLPSIYHHDFAKQYAWRGLAAMPAEGYQVGPYARSMFGLEGRQDGQMPKLYLAPGLEHPLPTRARVALEE